MKISLIVAILMAWCFAQQDGTSVHKKSAPVVTLHTMDSQQKMVSIPIDHTQVPGTENNDIQNLLVVEVSAFAGDTLRVPGMTVLLKGVPGGFSDTGTTDQYGQATFHGFQSDSTYVLEIYAGKALVYRGSLDLFRGANKTRVNL